MLAKMQFSFFLRIPENTAAQAEISKFIQSSNVINTDHIVKNIDKKFIIAY